MERARKRKKKKQKKRIHNTHPYIMCYYSTAITMFGAKWLISDIFWVRRNETKSSFIFVYVFIFTHCLITVFFPDFSLFFTWKEINNCQISAIMLIIPIIPTLLLMNNEQSLRNKRVLPIFSSILFWVMDYDDKNQHFWFFDCRIEPKCV